MRMREGLVRVTRVALRRPVPVLVTVFALALAGGLLALTLRPSAGVDTLADPGSGSGKATKMLHDRFGDDAIVILVKGEVTSSVLTSDLGRLVGLEGCIGGNVPRGVTPRGGPNGPCATLAREKPVQVVYGPGTFLNEAVGRLSDEIDTRTQDAQAQATRAAEAARKLAKAQGASKKEQEQAAASAQQLVSAQFVRYAAQIAVRYGIPLSSQPSIDNRQLVSSIVFDPSRGAGTPKSRFAYLFPNAHASIIQVRLKPDLSDAQRTEAIRQIRRATAMPVWKPKYGGTYTVTGAPVLVDALAHRLTTSLLVLLLGSLLVMAATLALVFRRHRMRLLPLALALAATGLTFGAMALFGASLTMASIAVLPVLVGLGVDYAIQFHARYDEALTDGQPPDIAAERAVAAGGPTIATAGLATIAGFLVLLLSPVPMVRDFGLLLVVGIALAFAVALTAGVAALVLGARRVGAAPPGMAGRASRAAARAGAAVGASLRGAAELVTANRAGRSAVGAVHDAGRATAAGFARALRAVTAHPSRTLAIAVAAACIGWVADTQTQVVSDVQRLVPQDLQELRDVQSLQNATDVSGEIDVVVEGKDLTDPRVVAWMTNYQQRVLKAAGFREGKACTTAKICPALSLPDLFASSQTKTKKDIEALLDNVPPYFSQAVITSRRDVATLAFGIRLMPFDQQKQVIDKLRSELDPPPGVTARLAGLPVLVAEANADLSSTPRRFLTLGVGLLLVFLVLLAAYRRLETALVPLIPIALATGWSALVLYLLRIPLNPMSATLGALVIAISTEFGVLLAARYRQEREAGHEPEVALDRTYRSTGAAVLASGATAIAGFGVLVLSDVRMLREFGFVTVVDLSVSLLGVLLVLPAVLLLAERGELLTAPRRALGRIPRPRRLPRPRARRAT